MIIMIKAVGDEKDEQNDQYSRKRTNMSSSEKSRISKMSLEFGEMIHILSELG